MLKTPPKNYSKFYEKNLTTVKKTENPDSKLLSCGFGGEKNPMRWKRFVAVAVLIIVVLMTAVYVYLNTYDYNKLKPLVARTVEDATGRKLSLAGDLDVKFGFWPTLVVTDVALANVSWGSQPQMLEIRKLQARVRLLPLLFKNVDVKFIHLDGIKVLLETGPNSQGNWDFPAGGNSSDSLGVFKPTAIEVDQVRIENLQLTYRGTGTGSPTQLTIAHLEMNRQDHEDALILTLRADYNCRKSEGIRGFPGA